MSDRKAWRRLLLVVIILSPFIFIFQTLKESKGCNQLVIDTYEIHSNIDIPNVRAINCYYDGDVRISVYGLIGAISSSKFEKASLDNARAVLNGFNLLSPEERPNSKNLLIAQGEAWGRKWKYLVDNENRRLWAEISYN